MRLTTVCLGIHRAAVTGDTKKWVPHKLYFGHGRGRKNVWGPRRIKYLWTSFFNHLWRLEGNRPLTPTNEEVPPGTVIYDANELAQVELHPPEVSQIHIASPWPYEPKYVQGSKDDPLYQQRPAFLYNYGLTLYEGIKGANHFTHSIVEENSFPPLLLKLEERLEEMPEVVEKFLPLLENRLHHALKGDSGLILLPKLREFPRLNWGQPRRADVHPFRRDELVLKAFSETSDLLVATKFSLNKNRKIQWPSCIVPFERNELLCVLDLKTNWITAQAACPVFNEPKSSNVDIQEESTSISQEHSGKLAKTKFGLRPVPLPLFSSEPSITLEKELPIIDPVDWRINFSETNFYPTTYDYSIPEPYRVNTIFLTNNTANPKPQPDRMVFGRGILYCYGYLVSVARRLYGLPRDPANEINYKDLPTPLTVQLAFYNGTKSNIGFICFQLNTLSFDSNMKNQVWLDGPYSIDDTRGLLKKFSAINLLSQGYCNN